MMKIAIFIVISMIIPKISDAGRLRNTLSLSQMCPDEAPEWGSTCDAPGLICNYGYMDMNCDENVVSCSPTVTYICPSIPGIEGWQDISQHVTACPDDNNFREPCDMEPEQQEPDHTVCPDEEPEWGSTCDAPGLTCNYGYMDTNCDENVVSCSPSLTYICEGGAIPGIEGWQDISQGITACPDDNNFREPCDLEPEPVQGSTGLATSKGICFSAQNTVMTRDKGSIAINNLEIGDMVYTGRGKFSPVYSFGHRKEDKRATYLQIHIQNVDDPLEISADHMLYVDKRGMIPAVDTDLGDHVVLGNGETSMVTKISTVDRVGVYAPFTKSGTIVVNGVLASNYIVFPEVAEVFSEVHLTSVMRIQWISHAFQAPHRIICTVINPRFCARESYTDEGISKWVYAPFVVSRWITGSGRIATFVLLVPIILTALIMNGIEAIFVSSPFHVIIVAMIGLVLFSHRNKQKYNY